MPLDPPLHSSQLTQLKTIRTLISAIFRRFGRWFWTLIILHDKHNVRTRYGTGYLFLKLVQINYIFSDNVHILYIHVYTLCIYIPM